MGQSGSSALVARCPDRARASHGGHGSHHRSRMAMAAAAWTTVPGDGSLAGAAAYRVRGTATRPVASVVRLSGRIEFRFARPADSLHELERRGLVQHGG